MEDWGKNSQNNHYIDQDKQNRLEIKMFIFQYYFTSV